MTVVNFTGCSSGVSGCGSATFPCMPWGPAHMASGFLKQAACLLHPLNSGVATPSPSKNGLTGRASAKLSSSISALKLHTLSAHLATADHTHSCMCICTHTRSPYTHTQLHISANTHMHGCPDTPAHAHSCMCICTHTHAWMPLSTPLTNSCVYMHGHIHTSARRTFPWKCTNVAAPLGQPPVSRPLPHTPWRSWACPCRSWHGNPTLHLGQAVTFATHSAHSPQASGVRHGEDAASSG